MPGIDHSRNSEVKGKATRTLAKATEVQVRISMSDRHFFLLRRLIKQCSFIDYDWISDVLSYQTTLVIPNKIQLGLRPS
jgi:hypothetical protein